MMKVVCLLMLGSSLHGQPLTHSLDSLMRMNFPAAEPGAGLLIAQQGKIIYAKGFGLTDTRTGKQQAISPSTNFRMASVSKQFTAMCIVLLQQQHKLSYNDKLLKFFPGWNRKIAAVVTVQQLLTHTSGLWDYEDLLPANQKEQVLDADVVNYLLKKDTLYFKPGTAFRYSNSGFCVLEQIVEIASGMSYPAFCQKHIFRPLKMNQSIIYQQSNSIANRAMGFARDSAGKLIASDQSLTSATKGDGGVYTSLTDYLKWVNWLMSGSAAFSKQLQLANNAVDSAARFNYGLGWFNFIDGNSGLTLYHTGSTCGFSNVVKLVPRDKLAVAFFSNIADNHFAFYNIEEILRQYNIDQSQTSIKPLIDPTR